MNRREFRKQTVVTGIAEPIFRQVAGASEAAEANMRPHHAGIAQTVVGPLDASKLGFTLTREHIADGLYVLKRWPKAWGGNERARTFENDVRRLRGGAQRWFTEESMPPFNRLLVILLIVLSACSLEQRHGSFVRTVFGGFRYIGGYSSESSYTATIADTSAPLPKSFEAHRVYIFQPNSDLDAITYATSVLPSKLKDAGVEVIGAPGNAGDFATPSFGGPVWQIGFRQGRFKGTIRNRVNRLLYARYPRRPAGSDDDIMVTFDN